MTTLQDNKESETFIPIKDQSQTPPNQRLKWSLMTLGTLMIIGVIIGVIIYFFAIDSCDINESCQTDLQILEKLNITVRNSFELHKHFFFENDSILD